MEETPLVSIIIPTYNRFELLKHAIRSVLNSTYKNTEIIVVNDKSTDERYYNGDLEKFPNTTVIHLEENQRKLHNFRTAQGAVRNYGIKLAKGEYICFLDDDDFFIPEKIYIQLQVLKHNPSVLICSTDMFNIIHRTINEDTLDYVITGIIHENHTVKPILKYEDIKKHNYMCNSTVMVHRSVVEKAGLQSICQYEDWEYWLRCLKFSDCIYINKPLVLYTTQNAKFYV